MTNPEPSSEKNSFKSLLIKGVISATALAGTTAIPLLVQRSIQTPPPATSNPTPAVTTPSQTTGTPATSPQNLEQDNPDKRPKKKS